VVDINTLLIYYKLLDDKLDSKKSDLAKSLAKSMLKSLVVSGKYKKAKKSFIYHQILTKFDIMIMLYSFYNKNKRRQLYGRK